MGEGGKVFVFLLVLSLFFDVVKVIDQCLSEFLPGILKRVTVSMSSLCVCTCMCTFAKQVMSTEGSVPLLKPNTYSLPDFTHVYMSNYSLSLQYFYRN